MTTLAVDCPLFSPEFIIQFKTGVELRELSFFSSRGGGGGVVVETG